MLYTKYLKKINQEKICPFCNLKKSEILRSNESANLILAKAPYSKDHLLIVPKRHIIFINDLTKEEKQNIEKLIYFGFKKLHEKHKNVTMLYREGNKKEVGKSIDHLHIHLIPHMQIGARDINWRKRKILSDKEYTKKEKYMRKFFD